MCIRDSLYTVYIAFHNSAERVNTQIDHAFTSAITEDYNERLAYISYYHPEPTNWDIKMYTICLLYTSSFLNSGKLLISFIFSSQ